MNPFSTTTSSDMGVQATDIVTAGLDLVGIFGPIVIIGLALLFAPKIFNLVRKALQNNNVYSYQDFMIKSVYDKNEKFHPRNYYKGLSKSQKYDEYLRVSQNGKRNNEW